MFRGDSVHRVELRLLAASRRHGISASWACAMMFKAPSLFTVPLFIAVLPHPSRIH